MKNAFIYINRYMTIALCNMSFNIYTYICMTI